MNRRTPDSEVAIYIICQVYLISIVILDILQIRDYIINQVADLIHTAGWE
ncbi:MAG: hypothetical protein JXB50_11110 [Spirochaetes bacterium]|nr:hypothetical protein [Spirochaetota bacterium]